MKLNNKMKQFLRRHFETIVFGLLFLLIIVMRFLNLLEDPFFIGVVGAMATMYHGVLKIKIDKDLLFKELFEKFNSTYDSKLNDLINELRYNEKKVLEQVEINVIIDYLNLCAEEYLWFKKNRIPSDVWGAWKAGIKSNLEITGINEIYKRETNSELKKLSFYGLCEELEIHS